MLLMIGILMHNRLVAPLPKEQGAYSDLFTLKKPGKRLAFCYLFLLGFMPNSKFNIVNKITYVPHHSILKNVM